MVTKVLAELIFVAHYKYYYFLINYFCLKAY